MSRPPSRAKRSRSHRGERIGMNFQYTYTPEAFRWLLHEHGGLEIETEYTAPDARFLTAICKK